MHCALVRKPNNTFKDDSFRITQNHCEVSFPAGYDYPSFGEYGQFAGSFANNGFIRVSKAGVSGEGRPLYKFVISSPGGAQNKKRVLFVGLHHGSEFAGFLFLYDYLRALRDESARRTIEQNHPWLGDIELTVLPMLNPDGYVYNLSTKGIYDWRGNTSAQRGDTGKILTYGVDLNRNYACAFQSGSDPRDHMYAGSFAFSEPETRALRDLVLTQGFDCAIDFHSFCGEIYLPYGHTAAPPPDRGELLALAAGFNRAIPAPKYRIAQLGRIGKRGGTAMDWMYEQGVLAITVELEYELYPDKNERSQMYTRIAPAVESYLNYAAKRAVKR